MMSFFIFHFYCVMSKMIRNYGYLERKLRILKAKDLKLYKVKSRK